MARQMSAGSRRTNNRYDEMQMNRSYLCSEERMDRIANHTWTFAWNVGWLRIRISSTWIELFQYLVFDFSVHDSMKSSEKNYTTLSHTQKSSRKSENPKFYYTEKKIDYQTHVDIAGGNFSRNQIIRVYSSRCIKNAKPRKIYNSLNSIV